MKCSNINPGNIVKIIGTEKGYKDTYSVIDTFTNDKGNGDDVILVTWQEPHSHVIRTQFLSPHIVEIVPNENNES